MDPPSILAATSFGFEALGFLLKTGFALCQITDQARECRDALISYQFRLRNCRVKVHEWNSIWSGFQRETYEYFWGVEVYNDTQSLLEAIRSSLMKIQSMITGKEYREGRPRTQQHLSVRKLLRSISSSSREDAKAATADQGAEKAKHRLSHADWNSWSSLTEDERKKAAESGVKAFANPEIARRQATLCFRIGFSLYYNNALHESLSTLEAQVEQLGQQTADAFRRARLYHANSERIEREDLNRAVDIRTTSEAFTAFSKELHASYLTLEHETPWAPELRVPVENDASHNVISTEEAYNIDIDPLLCLDGDAVQGIWRRVRIEYRPAHEAVVAARELPRQIIAPVIESQPNADVKLRVLESMERRSVPFRVLLHSGRLANLEMRKTWENDRAILIFGLTNWTVLMWNTPWTAVPCSCGIRFEKLRDSRQYTFAAENHEDCQNAQFTDHKLLLLGLVIAELLLGVSLRVARSEPIRDFDQIQIFDLERWRSDEIPPKWKSYSRYHLIGDIKALSGCDGLSEAIKFCFNKPGLGSENSLSPDERRTIVDKVVKPVHAYYDIVSKHRSQFSLTEWAKEFFWKKWPVEWLYEEVVLESDVTTDEQGRVVSPTSELRSIWD